MCATFAISLDDRNFPANSISNEMKAYMEKQQSVIDRLMEMMATMKKETSDP
jgi:acid stress-induced BolA-like protein IbaG/YrbA